MVPHAPLLSTWEPPNRNPRGTPALALGDATHALGVPCACTAQVVRLGVSRLRELMASGELVMGSTLCCLLALQHLEARGLVPPASSCVAAGGTGDGSSHSNGTGAAAAAADHS